MLPFLVGFALGNLDPKLREFFAPGGQLIIPFFAFALGNTIDLHSLLRRSQASVSSLRSPSFC